MAVWTHTLTDRNGIAIGELISARERKVSVRINRIDFGDFTIRTDNPMANVVRGGDQILVKAYRDGQLMAIGPLVPGYQKAVAKDARTVNVSWAGAGWRLSRRMIEASKTNAGVTYTNQDRKDIVASIINGLNSATPPQTTSYSGGAIVSSAPSAPQIVTDTGIRVAANPTTSITTVGPWYFKNALQALTDLSSTVDGFDWKIVPTEPTPDVTGIQLGSFVCAMALGGTRLDAMFEYGDGRFNVESFTETRDSTGNLQQAWSLPTSFPDNAAEQPVRWADIPAMTNVGTLYEDTVSSDLVTTDMRVRLAQQNVAVRKDPKTLITFIPSVSQDPAVMPQYGVDYVVGDLVPFRAVEYGVETINDLFRVYGVDFVIDQQGVERASPILLSTDI